VGEKLNGAFIQTWLEELKGAGFKEVDVAPALAELMAVKDQREQVGKTFFSFPPFACTFID
jgi:hypothetical protein